MNVWRVIVAICLSIFLAGAASAQQSWVQIEAQPTEREALSRANAYAAQLPDVNAFRLRSNWHAIALGPYSEAEARQRLLELRASRAVPSDAFVSDGRSFRDRIFGTGVAATAPAAPLAPPPVLEAGEETPAEARRSEAQLTREDRALIQTAMQWEGVYSSVIDASFGPGTRRAMADWQQLNGYEPTGILTTLQRRELVDGYLGVLDALGLAPVIDERAGIQVDMPAGLVRFDRYESPFAHYAPATDDGVRVVLISQSGDQNTLGALYDILQTLEIVPIEGERELGQSEFTIEGTNATTQSYTYARLTGGAVKGFTLAWPAGDEKRFRLALSRMRDSFTPLDGVLPDTEGTAIQNIDLLSGLEIRRPGTTASGFYIDGSGTVLTTSGAVAQCARVTLDGEVEAQVTARDDALGLALLTPSESLAPTFGRAPLDERAAACLGHRRGGLQLRRASVGPGPVLRHARRREGPRRRRPCATSRRLERAGRRRRPGLRRLGRRGGNASRPAGGGPSASRRRGLRRRRPGPVRLPRREWHHAGRDGNRRDDGARGPDGSRHRPDGAGVLLELSLIPARSAR